VCVCVCVWPVCHVGIYCMSIQIELCTYVFVCVVCAAQPSAAENKYMVFVDMYEVCVQGMNRSLQAFIMKLRPTHIWV
jgi:hypothetical protein